MKKVTIIKKVGRASKRKDRECGQVYLPSKWVGKEVKVELV